MSGVLGVIPARYHSSRLPGKPLADVCGRPMLWWVWNQARKVEELDGVVVATDDFRIEDACKKLGIDVLMTSPDHDTPTSRLCEVAQLTGDESFLMVMGDEPLVQADALRLILRKELGGTDSVAVLTNRLEDPAEVLDSSNQKVVSSEDGRILMISRSPIPYPKGTLDVKYEKVTGVQLFTKEALEFYRCTPKSLLEKAEENDLMRFVEHGVCVRALQSPYKTVSVDTPKDLEEVRRRVASSQC